jgi:hypothetical protein
VEDGRQRSQRTPCLSDEWEIGKSTYQTSIDPRVSRQASEQAVNRLRSSRFSNFMIVLREWLGFHGRDGKRRAKV